MQSHLSLVRIGAWYRTRDQAHLLIRWGDKKRPLRISRRVNKADAKLQMEPLPLVPATWMVFQGNSTPFRRRAMRSRPGWIMAGVAGCQDSMDGGRPTAQCFDVLKRIVTCCLQMEMSQSTVWMAGENYAHRTGLCRLARECLVRIVPTKQRGEQQSALSPRTVSSPRWVSRWDKTYGVRC
jgi:hypothetical protein